jgi:ribosomal protein S18 acetylase RimI-like enzyme
VRPATRRDLQGILDGWEALQQHGSTLDPLHSLASGARRYEEGRLLDLVFGAFHPWPAAWVAIADEQVVGMLTSSIVPPGPLARPPAARIDDCWVHPHHRRRGLGRTLVQSWQQAARAGGCRLFEVSTLSADADALAFWQALGFAPHRTTLTIAS